MVRSGIVMVQVAFLEPVPCLVPRPGMPIAALREPPRVLLADQLRLESRHAPSRHDLSSVSPYG